MSSQPLRVSLYRLRATLPSRLSGYVALVLLIGLLGGLAMGSVAAARRTQSSFTTFLRSTNPPDLTIALFSNTSSQFQFTESERQRVHGLPGVKSVKTWVQPLGVPLGPHDVPRLDTLSQLYVISSLDGAYFSENRPGVVSGRMPNANSLDEFVTTPQGAALYGWHLGQRVSFGFYNFAATTSKRFPTGAIPPLVRVKGILVGLVEFDDGVIQDDVDRVPTFALFTPALTRMLLDHGVVTGSAYYDLHLAGGGRDVAAAEREFARSMPPGLTPEFHVSSLVGARADRAIKPESIALGVFGLIAAVAALAIAGQALARQLRANQRDLEVLRALGATSPTIMCDGLIGILTAVVLGSLLATGVAVSLSPLSPIGPVRPVYPTPGVAADWTVLGLGLVFLTLGLGLLAVAIAYRGSPHRVATRHALVGVRASVLAKGAAQAGMPAPVVAGVRFALEPGSGRSAVPVRSSLLGMVLAVVVVVTTITFASGLQTLVSHPSLFGWNWSYGLVSFSGPDVPPQAVALLNHDPKVSAWDGATVVSLQLDGQTVPVILQKVDATVAPPIVAGHGVQSGRQIVLGAATMQQLHARLGGTVTVTFEGASSGPFALPPTPLEVVGTATMPAVGFSSSQGDHTSMGTGVVLPNTLIPPAVIKSLQSPYATLNGPQFVFVRMRNGLSPAAGLADMRRVADAGNRAYAAVPNGAGTGDTVSVLPVLRPAEIVNYRSTGSTPLLLAGGLAAGAVVAFGFTLVASVRRRRRDLALLKALGFTQFQLSAAVAVQATVVAVIGLLVGIPLGIALGRWLWDLFAREIFAVPDATVPVISIVIIAAAALVLVNLVAALPGRVAARTPTALVLRAE